MYLNVQNDCVVFIVCFNNVKQKKHEITRPRTNYYQNEQDIRGSDDGDSYTNETILIDNSTLALLTNAFLESSCGFYNNLNRKLYLSLHYNSCYSSSVYKQ